jgi:Phosphotransferase enzyme family
MDSVVVHDDLPHTFCHGDTHLANWYYTKDGRMGLSDWQGNYLGHWSRDFIYAISTASSIEGRREWQPDLLKAYLARSKELGMQEPVLINSKYGGLQGLWAATIPLTPFRAVLPHGQCSRPVTASRWRIVDARQYLTDPYGQNSASQNRWR